MSQISNYNNRGRWFWGALLAWCLGLMLVGGGTKYFINMYLGSMANQTGTIISPLLVVLLCFAWWLLGVTCMMIENYRRRICCHTDENAPVGRFWNSILDFGGRASRRQFWCGLVGYSFVIWLMMTVILWWVNSGILALIACLIFLIPLWALFVRRLHDVNASGWWAIVPCVGVLMCVSSWFITIVWGVSWYVENVGVDIWGLLIYLVSALYIGLIPNKKRK